SIGTGATELYYEDRGSDREGMGVSITLVIGQRNSTMRIDVSSWGSIGRGSEYYY
ncbi:hypothetical protein CWI39_3535p0010, partial [Hamiltosporidium magnivora]